MSEQDAYRLQLVAERLRNIRSAAAEALDRSGYTELEVLCPDGRGTVEERKRMYRAYRSAQTKIHADMALDAIESGDLAMALDQATMAVQAYLVADAQAGQGKREGGRKGASQEYGDTETLHRAMSSMVDELVLGGAKKMDAYRATSDKFGYGAEESHKTVRRACARYGQTYRGRSKK